jgi:aspartate/methionine/tyrosine aminotransferase
MPKADVQILQQTELEEQHLKYRTTLLRSGVTQLAELLARYVNRSNPVREVNRGNSVTGPGVGALLAQLIWAICEEGEGVLMTTVRTLISLIICGD